jgi:DNA-binding NarL/FixJ family response regulator
MKILLIDDHSLIREALQGLIKELRLDATVLEANDCRQAMRLAEEHADLELILLDLSLPDGDGFSVLADLRRLYPSVSIIVISATNDRDQVIRALDLGAVGFIPKSTQRSVMLSGIQLVLSGGIYIPPEIFARDGSQSVPAPLHVVTERSRVSPKDLGLTERQVEVLVLMMQAKSNKAICRVLHLSESTVKTHVAAIFKALRVTNRTEAVMAIVRRGWDLRPSTKEA